jgi:hypothetical protein
MRPPRHCFARVHDIITLRIGGKGKALINIDRDNRCLVERGSDRGGIDQAAVPPPLIGDGIARCATRWEEREP